MDSSTHVTGQKLTQIGLVVVKNRGLEKQTDRHTHRETVRDRDKDKETEIETERDSA